MGESVKNFDILSIEQQVKFINTELEKDKTISVTKLCKNFGLNKSTIISKFNNAKYKYDIATRKYILKNIDTNMIQDIKNIDIEEVSSKDITNDIYALLKYKDDILNMLKEYQSNSSSNKELIIDTSIISDKVCNHNFKIYENVKKEIQDLQSQYPQFRLADLVSTALHQFCIKNKV